MEFLWCFCCGICVKVRVDFFFGECSGGEVVEKCVVIKRRIWVKVEEDSGSSSVDV